MRVKLSRKRERVEGANGEKPVHGWLRIILPVLGILVVLMFAKGGWRNLSLEYFFLFGGLLVLCLCGRELLRVFVSDEALKRSFLPLMLTMLAVSICEIQVGGFAFARLAPASAHGGGLTRGLLACPNVFVPFFVAMLYGGPVALVIGLITSIAIAMVKDFDLAAFLISICSTCLAVRKATRASTYLDVVKVLCGVAVFQLFVLGIGVFSFMRSGDDAVTRMAVVQFGIFYGLFVLSGILLALVLHPAEKFTKRISNITVHKYADLEHPLLKRLSLKTPGTYHHVMMVGDLAQAAADAIGANGLLARAGAYYHDIGKLSLPSYYMENQSGSENPHDDLPPNISRIIIMNHVKEGLVLAAYNRLPEVLRRFIATHHGTSIARWFLMKERKRLEAVGPAAEKSADPENYYRYPGPLPVTREETIVSLADSVEAASRSMRFFDRAKIENLVNSIIADRWADGQLAASELTNAELAVVRQSFTTSLVHLLHGRLPYPSQK